MLIIWLVNFDIWIIYIYILFLIFFPIFTAIVQSGLTH